MKHPWLTLLSFGFIGALVLIFFNIYAAPLETPKPEEKDLPNIDEPSVTYVNPTKGAEEPIITIVEFGDFQCRYCKPLANDLQAVVETFPDQVRVAWKHMPNKETHAYAEQAAVAAQCAKRQGKFWEFHDQLFAQQSIISESLFRSIAQDLELDMQQFSDCYETRDTLPVVRRDLEEGLALELNATPTLFIGDERLVGQISRQEIQAIIRQKINQAEAEAQ